MAPWVVESEKKTQCLSLIGFLKPNQELADAALWLQSFWGRSTAGLKQLEGNTVHIQLLLEEEVRQVLQCTVDPSSSPFIALDRWMEVIGSPPITKWIHLLGVPLQAWNEGVFRLLGDFIGSTIEVDCRTLEKEVLAYGRVKVLTSRLCKLLLEIPLSIGDQLISVKAEEEEDPPFLTNTDIEETSISSASSEDAGEESPSFLALGSFQKQARIRRRARSRRRARFCRSRSFNSSHLDA